MLPALGTPCRGASRTALCARALGLLTFLLLCSTAAFALPLVNSFDTGAEGWRVVGDNAAAWNATGGNPGGCFAVNDLAVGDMCYAAAPQTWLGDWSALGAGDTLRVDYYLHNSSGGGLIAPDYVFRISGPGGAAHALIGASFLPPDGVWTTFRVSLAAGDWILESGGWSALLADVQSLRLIGEFVNGDEDVRLDNASLSSAPAHVFNPCLFADFNDGTLGDWSFANTGGTSNPGSGGNTRGFCQITDGSGMSYAYAPPIYLGDWSALDGAGVVTCDLRVLSASGTLADATAFLRLSGPGGAAHAGLDTATLPASTRVWRTYATPLAAASWTMESGTWSALLADVAECRLQVEFYNSTEKIGLDNFSRRLTSCAPIDWTVVTHLAGSRLCDSHSLVGATSPAYDPAGARPYALVELASGSGGGVYALTGEDAGMRLAAYELPTDLLFTDSGDAFISEDASGIVYRRSALGTSQAWASGFHTGDDDPAGMCIAPPGFDGDHVDPGDILVTDWGYSGPDEVWAFSPLVAEGERLVMSDPGETDFQDIAAGSGGVVYLCDALNANALSVLAPSGTLTPLPLSSAVPQMVSVVADTAAGRLYVAEAASHTVRAIDVADGTVSLVADGFVGLQMCALALDGPSRALYVADTGGGRVYKICLPATTAVRDPREAPDGATPAGFGLAIRPNPVTAVAHFSLRLATAGAVEVNVLDATGRTVWRTVTGGLSAGPHTLRWDGRDAAGRPVAAGVYVARVTGADGVRTARFAIVR